MMEPLTSLIIDLPWPPSVNRIWRQYKGRTIISKEYRSYKLSALDAVAVQMVGEKPPGWLSGRLRVHIHLQPRTLRRFDIDNKSKATLDILQSAGFDDEQIDELIITRHPHGKIERCVAVISPMEPGAAAGMP